jgi:hypothetical protein
LRAAARAAKLLTMPAIEPYVPRHEEEPPPRFVRWRFALAIVLTVVLMVAAIAVIMWLPPII